MLFYHLIVSEFNEALGKSLEDVKFRHDQKLEIGLPKVVEPVAGTAPPAGEQVNPESEG